MVHTTLYLVLSKPTYFGSMPSGLFPLFHHVRDLATYNTIHTTCHRVIRHVASCQKRARRDIRPNRHPLFPSPPRLLHHTYPNSCRKICGCVACWPRIPVTILDPFFLSICYSRNQYESAVLIRLHAVTTVPVPYILLCILHTVYIVVNCELSSCTYHTTVYVVVHTYRTKVGNNSVITWYNIHPTCFRIDNTYNTAASCYVHTQPCNLHFTQYTPDACSQHPHSSPGCTVQSLISLYIRHSVIQQQKRKKKIS